MIIKQAPQFTLPKIRSQARDADVAPRHAGWTYSFEFDALLQLGRAEEAWRLVRVNLWMHNAAKDPEASVRLITGPLPNIVVSDSKAFSALHSGELDLSWRS